MRDIDPAMLNALMAAPRAGLIPRRLAWFVAKNRDTGAPAEAGVWTGSEDLNISVVSGTTLQVVSRPYIGGLALESIGDIPRTSDFTVQTVSVNLSQLASAAQQLFRQYDLRMAQVEIHEVLIDPITRNQIAPAQIVMLGRVDGAPAKTPRRGETGSAVVKVVSDVMSMLTRKNPRKSSHQGQMVRQNDQWGKDSAVVSTWKIPWGQKSA
ncbi:hypothetical protein [Rhizobium sp. 11_C7_N12_5]|uniref:hypothetical protein n=1 Tax=Rhizobium sp. 11_C7_N12_5 TaxID=3240770 RepID=UPI003F23C90D